MSPVPDIPVDRIAQWALILGFFMPVAIAFIQQCHWSRTVKSFVALAVCFFAAGMTLVLSGQFNAANLLSSGLALLAATSGYYKFYWRDNGTTDAIEKATSLKPNDEEAK